MKTAGIPLHLAAKGSSLVIIDIPDGKSKAQLIRLGILKGELVLCLEKLPGGTIVIQKNRQEIAIGVSLAKTILVAHASPDPSRSHRPKK
ncbi:MAG: ferrous iron transport protein A [Bacteroidota bacterium]|jgi:ferrous iron transport protein A